MEHEFGTIQVKAEITEESRRKIECLQDLTEKYRSLEEKQKEHVYAIFLNNGNKEIGDKIIGLGKRDQAQFDIQDLVRTAALVNAAATILVHNHPSGNPQPTDNDIDTTKKIHDALETLGVQLLDHVIITRDSSYSMRRKNDGPL